VAPGSVAAGRGWSSLVADGRCSGASSIFGVTSTAVSRDLYRSAELTQLRNVSLDRLRCDEVHVTEKSLFLSRVEMTVFAVTLQCSYRAREARLHVQLPTSSMVRVNLSSAVAVGRGWSSLSMS
jgi:hypothetical protein